MNTNYISYLLLIFFLIGCSHTSVKEQEESNIAEEEYLSQFEDEYIIINSTLENLMDSSKVDKNSELPILYLYKNFVSVAPFFFRNPNYFENFVSKIKGTEEKSLVRALYEKEPNGRISSNKINTIKNYTLKIVDNNVTLLSQQNYHKDNYEVLPKDRVVEFSNVALNETEDLACFYFNQNCIDKNMNCQYSKFVFVRKVNDEWIISNEIIEWTGY